MVVAGYEEEGPRRKLGGLQGAWLLLLLLPRCAWGRVVAMDSPNSKAPTIRQALNKVLSLYQPSESSQQSPEV
jgi:hypothetical protein